MAVKLEVVLISIGLLSGALALLAADPRPLQFDPVYVAGDGDCEGTPCVTTITEALGLVNRSGTILVESFNGTYNETLNIDIPVTIRGESRDLVTVDGGFAGGGVIRIGSAQGITIEELTLQENDLGVEIGPKASAIILRGLRIVDSDMYGGIRAQDVTGLVIDDSEVLNTISYDAIDVQDSRNVTIGGLGNNVSGNAARGIYVNNSVNVTIRDNVIMNNRETGLNVSYSVDVTVANNLIVGNGGGFLPRGASLGPRPLQGGNGGMWFWQTDPTAVEDNIVMGSRGFAVAIGGVGSTDLSLRRNQITGNGAGVLVDQGASRILIADVISGNGGSGIILDNVTDIAIRDATITDNSGVGVHGQYAVNVMVTDSVVTGNCAVVPFGTRSEGIPGPRSGHGGGLWFWQTDPSAIQGNTISDNCEAGIVLRETLDFDVLDNRIERNWYEGILLESASRSRISGNMVLGGEFSTTGTALVDSDNITVGGNGYRDLPVGIRISGGCDIGLGLNSFLNVTVPLQIERDPCNVLFSGVATLRFTPTTLNLRSQGNFVTLHFEVEGLEPSQFDVSTLVFTVNDVSLTPPPGSASNVQVQGDTIKAMVKLDRAECIAAFGSSGTYVVTVSGEFMPGVMWVASDTVEAFLP